MIRILIYGYGNPGRKDDGLGIYFAEEMECWAIEKDLKNLHFEISYQLNPEDAVVIADFDVVIFADASVKDISDYVILNVTADAKADFILHSVSPAYVTYLCNTIYERSPAVYLLHIKGYQWQLEEGLSERAGENLKKALDYVQNTIDKLVQQNQTAQFNFDIQTQSS